MVLQKSHCSSSPATPSIIFLINGASLDVVRPTVSMAFVCMLRKTLALSPANSLIFMLNEQSAPKDISTRTISSPSSLKYVVVFMFKYARALKTPVSKNCPWIRRSHCRRFASTSGISSS